MSKREETIRLFDCFEFTSATTTTILYARTNMSRHSNWAILFSVRDYVWDEEEEEKRERNQTIPNVCVKVKNLIQKKMEIFLQSRVIISFEGKTKAKTSSSW